MFALWQNTISFCTTILFCTGKYHQPLTGTGWFFDIFSFSKAMSGCWDHNAFSRCTTRLTNLLYITILDTGSFFFHTIPVMSQCRNTFSLLVWDSITQRTLIVFTFSGSGTSFCTRCGLGFCPFAHLMSDLWNYDSTTQSLCFTIIANFSFQTFLGRCCFFYDVFYPGMICFWYYSCFFVIAILTGSGLCPFFCTGSFFFYSPGIIILMSCCRNDLILRYLSASTAHFLAVSIFRTGSRLSFILILMSSCRNICLILYVSTDTTFFPCITSFRTGGCFLFFIVPMPCSI